MQESFDAISAAQKLSAWMLDNLLAPIWDNMIVVGGHIAIPANPTIIVTINSFGVALMVFGAAHQMSMREAFFQVTSIDRMTGARGELFVYKLYRALHIIGIAYLTSTLLVLFDRPEGTVMWLLPTATNITTVGIAVTVCAVVMFWQRFWGSADG